MVCQLVLHAELMRLGVVIGTVEARRQGPHHLGGHGKPVDLAIAGVIPRHVPGCVVVLVVVLVPVVVVALVVVWGPSDLNLAFDAVVMIAKRWQDRRQVCGRLGAVVLDDVVPEERPGVGLDGAGCFDVLVLVSALVVAVRFRDDVGVLDFKEAGNAVCAAGCLRTLGLPGNDGCGTEEGGDKAGRKRGRLHGAGRDDLMMGKLMMRVTERGMQGKR